MNDIEFLPSIMPFSQSSAVTVAEPQIIEKVKLVTLPPRVVTKRIEVPGEETVIERTVYTPTPPPRAWLIVSFTEALALLFLVVLLLVIH